MELPVRWINWEMNEKPQQQQQQQQQLEQQQNNDEGVFLNSSTDSVQNTESDHDYTVSSSPVPSIPQPQTVAINGRSLLYVGQEFSSMAEFLSVFERWKGENYHPFRVASSETLRKQDGSIDETFKYRYVVYHCAYYGQPRKRGLGKRSIENHLPRGCRAKLRLNYIWTANVMRVTSLTDEHNGHCLTPEVYKWFCMRKSRRSSSKIIQTSEKGEICIKEEPTTDESQYEFECPSSSCNGSEFSAEINNWPDEGVEEGKIEENGSLESTVEDDRTDDQRFESIHVVLQGLCDHLINLKGAMFDAHLEQLNVLMQKWKQMDSD
ncbi:hypothetical protein T02_7704 [Trichinella nativa]|uniref:ZSWIM3 N-terminal domain-containing protein n=1 Tax=Trichinella nativa TaxID=6335 RepID=A0A0V1L878_9BILA|nr:hypothetical protein T02_7704 [Trichinella nativa]